jgi:serine/threonine protein kinase
MIGTQIANYRIEERLGEGGMGVVYKAVDVNLERTVALKFLATELNRDPGLIERFQSEAKAQANLNHTNIATLYNFINVDGNWLIAMEYVDGENLEQLIQRTQVLQYEYAIPLFKQALLGIGFAHRFGIVHRDIKPANIMLNRYGIVKVMDFGIAKALSGRKLTRTGVAVGTVAYMSPEQIRNQNVDIRSDIYSLGITLYQMLTGHLPFESDSDFQVQYDHVNTPPPPLSLYYPYIPPAVEAAVLKAVEKDPANRFRTVEEFGAALELHYCVLPKTTVGGAGTGVTGLPGLESKIIASPPPDKREIAGTASGEKLGPLAPLTGLFNSGLWTPRNRLIAAVAGLVFVVMIGLAIWKRPHETEARRLSGGSSSGGSSSPISRQDEQQSSDSQPVATLTLPSADVPNGSQDQASSRKDSGVNHGNAEINQKTNEQTNQGTDQKPQASPQILAGTPIAVQLESDFNSDMAAVGQLLPASVVTSVSSSAGKVIVERGANAQLKVIEIDKSGEVSGRSRVRLALVGLSAGGKMMPIAGASKEVDGPSQAARTAERTGFGAAAGAVVVGITGKIFHHARAGAAAGAGAGGATGALTSHPAPVKLSGETVLQFRLTRNISTSS